MMGKYQELRYALSQNPTPGPWRVVEIISVFESDMGYRSVATTDNTIICDLRDRPSGDAHLIAACDPDTIRALLAERDALRVALEDELIWHEAQDKAISKLPDANTGHTWWRRMQHQEHAEIIRAALAQGQGGSDGNQD